MAYSNQTEVPLPVLIFGGAGFVIALAAAVNFAAGLEQALFNLGVESNLPTWFSSMQFFVIALVLFVIVVRDVRPKHPKTWPLGMVPLLFLVLSIDEVAMLHERAENLGALNPSVFWARTLLPLAIVWLIGLGFGAAVAFRPYVRDRRDARLLLAGGLGILLFAAVILEFAASFVGETSLVYRGLGFAEEYGEMLGGTIILWGSLVVARREGVRLELGRPRDRAGVSYEDESTEPHLRSGVR